MIDQQAQPDTPARRSTDLPPDAPWWAHWIANNWDGFRKWIKRVVAILVMIAPQLPAQLTALGVPASIQPHILSALGVVMFLATIESKFSQ